MALRLILTDGNGIQALALGFGAFINTNYAQIEAAVLSVAQSAATASAAASLSTTNANNAQANATAAGNSATAAAASAASATGSATSAGNSATAASSSATTAGNQAIASANSASAAAASASAAAGSATAAATSASNAAATLANALTKANNLSDVANVATARGNLSAAAKGANSDITSITGLTTALGGAYGGTGRATLTAHTVLVGNGTSAVTMVGPGTTGQPLLSGGASADPAYGTLAIAAGGTGATTAAAARVALAQGRTLLATIAAISGATTVEFDGTLITSDYDNYEIEVIGLFVSATTSGLYMRLSTDGTTYITTANYHWMLQNTTMTVPGAAVGSTQVGGINATAAEVCGNLPIVTGSRPAYIRVKLLGVSSLPTMDTRYVYQQASTNTLLSGFGGAWLDNVGPIKGIQFLVTSATFVAGTFRLYGINQ